MSSLRFRFLGCGAAALLAAVAAGLTGHDLLMQQGLTGAVQVAGGVAVLLLVTGWPLWLALDRWVLAPLELLAGSDRRVQRGDLLGAFVPEPASQEDEMGIALRTRNVMLKELIDKCDALERAKARAEATANDLTRMLAELKTIEARHAAQLESIIEHLPAGVCVLDWNRHVLITNPEARGLLHETASYESDGVLATLAGSPIDSLFEAEHADVRRELQSAGTKPRTIEVSAAPLSTEASRPGWVLLLRDVTEERERQRMLDRQSRLAAVGQLAAGIAHDFNNMLTAIIGFAELIQGADSLEQVRTDAGHIVRTGRRASQLIRQILDFSRKSSSQRCLVDLVPIVREVLDMVESTLPETIRVRREVDLERCSAIADSGQLGQVLTNLVVNARDAMHRGGCLTVRLCRATVSEQSPGPTGIPSGAWSVLSVCDTGPGITQEVLDHMFEPFFTTKSAAQGTGLGLAQVYGIVKQHGGFIEVDPGPGKGARFSVWLPVMDILGGLPENSAHRDAAEGRGDRVLLVEDDPGVREALARILESLGFRVDPAVSGLDAGRRLADAELPDVILSDVVMPEMGGLELLRQMREGGCDIPVVLMSGYPIGDDAARHEAAASAWLEKPVEPDVVARTLRRVVDERRGRVAR